MVEKIKVLLCKYFGHKWKVESTKDYHSRTWKCERCGKTQIISDGRC